MLLTPLQTKTAIAIVNVFETGSALGNYGAVTVIAGDAGHLTYGRSQTTITTGNLYLLIQQYCDAAGAIESRALQPFLDRLKAKDLSLDHDEPLKAALRRAGSDPVMQAVQDAFFDHAYWNPAAAAAAGMGIMSALGVGVVYDSHIHGSWNLIRDRTLAKYGTVAAIGEAPWVDDYVNTRRSWFVNHSNPILHRSVRRMDTFKMLIDIGNWNLDLPFTVLGVSITESVLSGAPQLPVLRLGAKGDDVIKLQRALLAAGVLVEVDGDFGPRTDVAVRSFQSSHELHVDGIVGAMTWDALGVP